MTQSSAPSSATPRRLAVTAAVTALFGSALHVPASASAIEPGMPTAAASRSSEDLSPRQTYQRLVQARAGTNPVRIDLLAINDFHGALEVTDPDVSSAGRINNTPAGGVAYLARHLKELRAKARANGSHPITVAAGDLIGGSPLVSAAFHDEPTIEAMNRVGLEVASVGNHEFDEGKRELLRMQRGGCLRDGDGRDNQDSCPNGRTFGGADFRYLAANVLWADQAAHRRSTLLPATKVIKKGGVKVGFIGMTLEGTPDVVTRAGIEGLRFADEVRTANRLVPSLRARGVESIVVLLHQGAVPHDPTAYDACNRVKGPAVGIAKKLSPRIDAVVSGHTHQPYNCMVKDPKGQPRLLTSASALGRMVTDIHLLVDPRTGNVVREAAYAQNRIVTNKRIAPVRTLARLVNTFTRLVEPIAGQVIGHTTTGTVSREQNAAGESPLGDLIADSQLAAESVVPPDGEAPQIAFMNPGGIRDDLLTEAGNAVTYGAAFTVQPFNNFLVSMDLTGKQIDTLLEQQFSGANETFNKVLQVSEGFSYTWDASAPAGSKVDPTTIKLDGEVINPDATYRIVANNFLSDGGDGFLVLTQGQNKYVGGLDIDALADYLEANDPYDPTSGDGRITRVG